MTQELILDFKLTATESEKLDFELTAVEAELLRFKLSATGKEGGDVGEDLEWTKFGTLWPFNALEFVLTWNWSNTPGDYTNGFSLTLPVGATEVKVVPISGYHIVAFGGATPYGIGIEFKTQAEWKALSYDPGGNRIPDQIATSAEATEKWIAKGETVMSLGTDLKLAWGQNDTVLTDNRDSQIRFEIYYR